VLAGYKQQRIRSFLAAKSVIPAKRLREPESRAWWRQVFLVEDRRG
jgi:hypothetical protein